MFSKSLFQFSADGWGCIPPLWGQTMVGGMAIMVTSYKGTYSSSKPGPRILLYSVPWPCSRPARQPIYSPSVRQRLLDTLRQVCSVSYVGHCCFLWVLVGTRFCLCPPRFIESPLAHQSQIPRGFSVPCARSPGWEICCGPQNFATVLWLVPWFSMSEWLTSLGVISFATSPVSASHFLIDAV